VADGTPHARSQRHAQHRVLYIQYTNPAMLPPLEHSSRYLADRGWSVLFLGVQSQGGAERLSFPPHSRIKTHNLPFCPPGWLQKLHFCLYTAWVLTVAIVWRPEWIYASDLFVCPTALILSLLPWMRSIYHEHDWPGGVPKTGFARACLWSRAHLARRSHLCILPNPERLQAFVHETRRTRRTVCVRNYPALSEVPPVRTGSSPGLRLYYHGTLVAERLPLAVLHAMSRLPARVTLTIVGYETVGARGYLTLLQSTTHANGLADRVCFVPAMPRHELLECTLQHDVGLSLMPMQSDDLSMREMVGASNKVFDYLACGLPLIVSSLPGWIDAYVSSSLGRACQPDDPDSIAEAVMWFLDHPVERARMAERGRQRILREWHYERDFQFVHRLMETA
jgi:glycosyltransferase involved in cell wall biosynthesis